MAIKRIDYVDQPLVQRRYTPDTSRLASLLTQGASNIAAIDLQKGRNATALFDRLGSLWSGYQELEHAKEVSKAALALREKERGEERADKDKDRQERKAERDEAAKVRQNDIDRAAASRMVEDIPPGPIEPTPENQLALQFIARFPEAAARLHVQRELPARPVDPSMPPMGAPETFTTRVATGPEMRQAGADQRQIEATAAAAKERAIDNARADAALRRSEAAQKSTEAYQERMAGIAQQNANTTAKRYSSTGMDVTNLDPAFADALDSAIMSFPQTKRRPVVDQASRAAATGDVARVKEIIKQAALEGENVDSRNQIRSRQATIAALSDAKSMIQELKAAGVPTGWFTGTAEDLARKIGTTTDPKLVELKTRLMDSVIQYRRAATGVAFGEREGQDYAQMFPNYKQTLPVNEAVIAGLSRAMKGNDRNFWENKLGKKGAALVVGDDEPAAQAAGGVKVLSITPVPAKKP